VRSWGLEGGDRVRGGGRRKGGIMTQSLYVHMNKGNKKIKNKELKRGVTNWVWSEKDKEVQVGVSEE
jgi:hypothetical protein